MDQLDALQDHVLAELDALDLRIADLIRQCTAPQLKLAPAPQDVPGDRAA